MPRSSSSTKFAKRRELELRAVPQRFRTPILVPSFSSKGFADVGKIIELAQPFLDSQILISAYDLHHGHIADSVDLNFPPLIFMDSGGYEASQNRSLQDPATTASAEYVPSEEEWTVEKFEKVIEDWKSISPTIFVNFDHPKKRVSLEQQIADALKTGGASRQIDREFLIKPHSLKSKYVDVDEICAKIKKFAPFIAIGVTEDEIGHTLHKRLVNIGRIREALDKAKMATPIHVFGSLDTITTLLYFVMGADIFDGLTWLRYGYHEGSTVYLPSLAAIKFPRTQYKSVERECWHHNYLELQEMEQQMRSFLSDGNFDRFGQNSALIKKLYDAAVEELGV